MLEAVVHVTRRRRNDCECRATTGFVRLCYGRPTTNSYIVYKELCLLILTQLYINCLSLITAHAIYSGLFILLNNFGLIFAPYV